MTTDKEFENLIDIRKNLWTTFIVLSGGLSGLLFNLVEASKVNLVFAIKTLIMLLGSIAVYFLFISIIEINNRIEQNLYNRES